MASQPSNTDISVYIPVRSQRLLRRHDTIEAITKKQRGLNMVVPGEENLLTEVKARDTARRDYSSYGRDGQPIVIGPGVTTTFAVAQAGMTSADFFFEIGNDRFIPPIAATLSTSDLFEECRDAA